jgi:hypothetical protein
VFDGAITTVVLAGGSLVRSSKLHRRLDIEGSLNIAMYTPAARSAGIAKS